MPRPDLGAGKHGKGDQRFSGPMGLTDNKKINT